jgi:hypothetical protein
MRNRKGADVRLVLLLTAAQLAYVLLTQRWVVAKATRGLGWDGMQYYLMASGGIGTVGYPYGERIAIPFLARHFLFDDVRINFELINLLCGVGFSLLFYLAVTQLIPDVSRLAVVTVWALAVGTHLSPVPQAAWYPCQTDVASNFLAMACIYAALKRNRAVALCFFIFLSGTLVRENFPMFAVILLIGLDLRRVRGPFEKIARDVLRANRNVITNVAASVAGSAVGYTILIAVAPYNPLVVKRGHLVRFLRHNGCKKTTAAAVMVYGVAVLFFLLWRTQRSAPRSTSARGDQCWLLLPPLVVLVLLGTAAGLDTERYFFWSLPLVALLVAPGVDGLLKHRRYSIWAVGFVFMLVWQRSLLPIEASGMGGCGLGSYLTGRGTFVGHWAQQCSEADARVILIAYAAAAALAVVAGVIGERRARAYGNEFRLLGNEGQDSIQQ